MDQSQAQVHLLSMICSLLPCTMSALLLSVYYSKVLHKTVSEKRILLIKI